MLASEYGWAKNDILENVYFDDLYYLVRNINKRHLHEYKMQLAISENPHKKDNRKLWDILNSQDGKLDDIENDNFDSAGFEMLKARMRSNPRLIIKK